MGAIKDSFYLCLLNGSQCSHPYLWIAHIPAIGTTIRVVAKIPKVIGFSIVCLTRISIVLSPNDECYYNGPDYSSRYDEFHWSEKIETRNKKNPKESIKIIIIACEYSIDS